MLDVVFNGTSMKGGYEKRSERSERPGASNRRSQSRDLLRLRIPLEETPRVVRVEEPVPTAVGVMLVPVKRPEALPVSALLVENMLMSEPFKCVRCEES
jgi:hypothetical protein